MAKTFVWCLWALPVEAARPRVARWVSQSMLFSDSSFLRRACMSHTCMREIIKIAAQAIPAFHMIAHSKVSSVLLVYQT